MYKINWNITFTEVFRPFTQYFVQAFVSDYSPESSWVWRYKLGTPVFGEFLPFFSADPFNSVRLGGERFCTVVFRSLQRCSIGFKSGLWLGHSRTFSRTFRDLSQSHSCIVIVIVCLGSLSCWKVNLHHSLRSWAHWSRFSSAISLYCSVNLSLEPYLSPIPCRLKKTFCIQAKEFNLGFIRPENVVSHGLRVL